LRAKDGAKWQARPAQFSAWVADMDFPVAPAITDAMRDVLDRNTFGYPNWGGPYALSPAAKMYASRMSDRFGWEVRPDRVRDMIDVLQGVRATVLHLSKPGDGVVLHMPAYHPFLDTLADMDRRLVSVVRRDGAFDYEALEVELAASGASIWILCHPHNPIGHVFDRAELERIAEIAERFDLTVISDEIHADLTMPGYTHVPFESLGAEASARAVTLMSGSKAFNLAGLRWAVMHTGSDRMQAAFDGMPGHYLGAPNLMAVTATVAAWNHGDEWLAAVIEVIDENRQALSGLLAQHLPGVVYQPPSATYLTWLDCRALGLGANPAETFRERGVALSAGPEFGPQGEGHVRLNIATSPAVLAATVEAMAG
jgi:cystathionine beta-lyase